MSDLRRNDSGEAKHSQEAQHAEVEDFDDHSRQSIRPPSTTPLIREYKESDLDALRRIHARQGFDYAFPDLRDPIFVSKLVVEEAEEDASGASADAHAASRRGHIVMASLARLTCEIYLLADPDAGTPRNRYDRLLALHRAGAQDLLARGLDDAHAWLPPPIAKRFGRRLESLGWLRDVAWTPYCFRFRAIRDENGK